MYLKFKRKLFRYFYYLSIIMGKLKCSSTAVMQLFNSCLISLFLLATVDSAIKCFKKRMGRITNELRTDDINSFSKLIWSDKAAFKLSGHVDGHSSISYLLSSDFCNLDFWRDNKGRKLMLTAYVTAGLQIDFDSFDASYIN